MQCGLAGTLHRFQAVQGTSFNPEGRPEDLRSNERSVSGAAQQFIVTV
jgi:hypothetical protein